MSGGKLNWQGFATWTTYAGKEVAGNPSGPAPRIYFPVDALGDPIANPIAAMKKAVEECSKAVADGGTGGGLVWVGCDYPTTGDFGYFNDAFAMTYQRENGAGVPVFADGEAELFLYGIKNVVIDFGGATLRRRRFRRMTPQFAKMLHLFQCENVTILNLTLDGNRFEAPWEPEVGGEIPAAEFEPFGTFAPPPPPATETVQPLSALKISGCKNITLRNVHVREAHLDGFEIGDVGGVRSEGITLEDCSAQGCVANGLAVGLASDIRVIRCRFVDNARLHTRTVMVGEETAEITRHPLWDWSGDGAHLEGGTGDMGIAPPSISRVVFRDCVFRENGLRGMVLSGWRFPDGVVVDNCHFLNNARRLDPAETWGINADIRASHLVSAVAGLEVTRCSFGPMASIDTARPAGAEQPPFIEVRVNDLDEDVGDQPWRKARARISGCRFVMKPPGTAGDFARRTAILAYAGGAPVEVIDNHFEACWQAATFYQPECRFEGNNVVDSVVFPSGAPLVFSVQVFARGVRVVGNRFVNGGAAVRVAFPAATLERNVFRYADGGPWDYTGVRANQAVFVAAGCEGRGWFVDNQFERILAEEPPLAQQTYAILFGMEGANPPAAEGPALHLRGNAARGNGWKPGGSWAGPWAFSGSAYAANLVEAWGNEPALPGEVVTQPGRGLRLGVADTSFAVVPGTLWYENSGNGRWMAQDEVGSRPVVRGPTSSADNFLPRFDGTTGALLQGSSVSVDDSGNLILGSSARDIQFGASVGGSYRRIRGVAGGLNIEDTTGGNTATISLLAAHVDLDALQHVTVRQSGTAWARFTSAQRLGLGTTSPGHRLHVVDTQSSTHVAQVENLSTSASASGLRVRINATPTHEANLFVRFSDSGYTKGSISGTAGGSGCLYNTSSDARLKSGIRPAPAMLPAVLQIEVSQFESAQNPVVSEIGFIAQQLNRHYPDATTDPAALNRRKVVWLRTKDQPEEPLEERLVFPEALPALEADPTLHIERVEALAEGHAEYMYWQVDYSKLTPALTGAIQELHAIVQTQAAQIAALTATVDALTAALAALTARLGPSDGG